MNTRRTTGLSTVALTALLALTACGGSDTSTTASGGTGTPAASSTAIPANAPYDAQDVAFATDMRAHHAQAIEMADIVLGKGPSAPVKALAERIKAEQSPEISQLDSFLTTFGRPAPATGSMSGMAGMDSSSMPGMMSEGDMTTFRNATGTDAEKQFLTLMTEHHSGAITMAQQELSSGTYPQALALAKGIVGGQQREITEMKRLLTKV